MNGDRNQGRRGRGNEQGGRSKEHGRPTHLDFELVQLSEEKQKPRQGRKMCDK